MKNKRKSIESRDYLDYMAECQKGPTYIPDLSRKISECWERREVWGGVDERKRRQFISTIIPGEAVKVKR